MLTLSIWTPLILILYCITLCVDLFWGAHIELIIAFYMNHLIGYKPKARRQFHWVQVIFKCVYFNCPSYLKQFLVPYRSSYSLRHMQYPFFSVPRIFKEVGRRSFQYKAPADWNNLPLSLRSGVSNLQHTKSHFPPNKPHLEPQNLFDP